MVEPVHKVMRFHDMVPVHNVDVGEERHAVASAQTLQDADRYHAFP